ncbi:MAG: hypothetical protein HUU20_24645 [Pirellulales bacterium]|nr:hypothetical protein [Pirellulales bacterium]
MRRYLCFIVGVVAVAATLGSVAPARGETCTLALKKADSAISTAPGDRVFQSSYPQTFFHSLSGSAQIVAPDPLLGGAKKPDFSTVIKKEPARYVAEAPFRAVAELGGKYYGFAVDIQAPEKGPDDEKANEDGKAASTTARNPADRTAIYSRLHFDLNHNGDLTDDAVIEAASVRSSVAVFPAVELQLDFDGKRIDYAFRLLIYSRASGSVSYATAQLSAAAYREGEITLDGKPRRVVLVDLNSNGRFDDSPGKGMRVGSNGAISSVFGDMLYIDPQPTQRSFFGSANATDQFHVGKVIRYGDRYFDLEVPPGGETLTLKPTSRGVGFITNANRGFLAYVYGDLGVLEVADNESGKCPLPEGEWKLLSYTIERKGLGDAPTVLDVLFSALPTPPTRTLVSARGILDSKAIKVVAGETVELPFGPPYHPKVTGAPTSTSGNAAIALSLVGTAGEICNGILVNGSRPEPPEFTISIADGKQVETGKFKYG